MQDLTHTTQSKQYMDHGIAICRRKGSVNTSFCGYMLRLSMVQSPTKVIGSDKSEITSVVQLCGVASLGSQLYSIAAVPCMAYHACCHCTHKSSMPILGSACQIVSKLSKRTKPASDAHVLQDQLRRLVSTAEGCMHLTTKQ